MDTNFDYVFQTFFLSCPTLILILFPLLLIIYFLNAEFRKGSLRTIRAHYSSTFTAETSPSDAFKAIMKFAYQNGYRIDDFDEAKRGVVLNERMTFTSYGSLYPIYVRENQGKTLVEVGVTSKFGKFFLLSPINKKLVTLRLERMLNGVKSAIYAFGTRI